MDSEGYLLCLPWASPGKVKPEDELLPPGQALAQGREHPASCLAWMAMGTAHPRRVTSGKPLSLLNIHLHPKEASISSPTIVFF